MPWLHVRQRRVAAAADRIIESILFGLSVYAVPLAVGAVSLIALVFWESNYSNNGGTPLSFRALEQKGGPADPAAMAAELRARPAVGHLDTRRSERPFWLLFEAGMAVPDDPSSIELPSRHATEVTCWNAQTLAPLGRGDRNHLTGIMERAKAGFALQLSQVAGPLDILCRANFVGPARISVLQWSQSQLDRSIDEFHHNSGLLEGGLILLAAFVLMTAIINREWTYVIFAAWLVANLRLAAISAGWDTQWLEHAIPNAWLYPIRKLVAAAYYILTVTLFSRLFREELQKVGYTVLLRAVQWACVPLLAAAIAFPFALWLPWLWTLTAFGIAVLVFLLARIVMLTLSTVAMWYGASLGLILIASFYEVVAAVLGAKEMIGSINFVTASLSSSLLAALAIAEQIRQERHQRVQAQSELRHAYEAIPLGLFTLDAAGAFLRVNPALAHMLGENADAMPGRRWSDFFDTTGWAALQELTQSGAEHEIELRSGAPGSEDGKWFLVKATLARSRIEGSLQDVSDRVEAVERLRFLADHDPLTGVLNRRGLEQILEKAIEQVARGKPLALAYLDLDRFKLINDLFGHKAGDEILKQVCERISDMLGAEDCLGRVGGDEFIIALRASPHAATWTCRGIVDRISTVPYQIADSAFQVTGSIGVVEVPPGSTVTDAISMANRACLQAKKGHHGLVSYEKDSVLFRERESELRLISRLGAGAAPAGLFLEMQPIMSLHSPFASLNFEVLLRMREAGGAVIPAGKIVSAAENQGRIAVIDRWVLTTTLDWLERHAASLSKTQFVCVNLSGGSLNDENFIRDSFSILAERGGTAQRLCIEITESVALRDMKNTRRFIDRVREFGAKVALDDFGAGYTSFTYLKELAADVVKIDGNFVKGVRVHPTNLAIVQAIVELANNLGMKSIAEWAEDTGTVEVLAEVGVDYVQGYAIARPQAPEAILGAESSASFIQDEQLALYVRNELARKILSRWEAFDDAMPDELGPTDLH